MNLENYKTHRTLYTKKQVLLILKTLGFDDLELPRKGKAVFLSIPFQPPQRIVKDGNMYARELFLPNQTA